MQQEPPAQGVSGCLKAALPDVFSIVLGCCIWYLFIGPKGILVGIGLYLAYRFGLLFERVFKPTLKGNSQRPSPD